MPGVRASPSACHLLPIDPIEHQDAATDYLALVYWFEGPCCVYLVGTNHHFKKAGLNFFHAATEHDAAPD